MPNTPTPLALITGGGQRLVWVESREAGLQQIAVIGTRRQQHGYREQ